MITFAAPWALLGLLAAALPILLHLAQRREPPEVAFPAVRYLDDTTREHRRRLKLQHWLLLAVRTLLIIVLVLAAAGMRLRRAAVGGHPPTALVLVVDNSASSGVMIDGTPMLQRLLATARDVLGRATASDRLWLITADGVARPGSAAALGARLDALAATGVRLDLGAAILQGRDLIRGTGLPGEVVVVSDLQRTALGAAPGEGAILVLRPADPVPANRSILQVEPTSFPWGVEGGDIRVALAGSDTAPVPVTLALGDERGARRELLLTPGVPTTVHLPAARTGWSTLTVQIPPDELRLDDTRELAIEVAPPAQVRWTPGDRFLDAALDVLVRDGRLIAGEGVRVGSLGPGPSLVFPPADAAQIGGLNRALAARGIPWQFGTVLDAAAVSDSAALLPERVPIARRVTLRATGATGDVLLTAGGDPWLVRGGDVLLLGSRPDPAWSELPLSASFVPLMDALLTRAVRGRATAAQVSAGAPFALPGTATAVAGAGRVLPMEGGAPWRPTETGIYRILAGADTLASVSVHVDPRESDLARAADDDVVSLWPGATVASLDDGAAFAFGSGRGDLRKTFLLLALACVVAETLLARRGLRSVA